MKHNDATLAIGPFLERRRPRRMEVEALLSVFIDPLFSSFHAFSEIDLWSPVFIHTSSLIIIISIYVHVHSITPVCMSNAFVSTHAFTRFASRRQRMKVGQ